MKQAPEDDPKLRRVIAAGAARGLEVRPVLFDDETRTALEAARAIGCDVAQIVKSLVFTADGRPLLLLVSGRNRVDLAKAAAVVGVERLEKADAHAARSSTGFSIGATPPFGHDANLDIYMDEDLLEFTEVWAAAGRVDAVFPADPRSLRDATAAIVAALREQ